MKSTLIRAFVSLAFIALLFYFMRDDIPLILHTLKNVNVPLLSVSIVVFLSSVWLMSRRLQLIFDVKGLKIPLSETVNLTLVGTFFNNFLPTSVGGDIVKAMCAARITKNAVTSVTVVLMDRIFGLFTFILIPSVSLLFYMKQIENPLVGITVYSLLGVSIFSFFLLFNRSTARRFSFVETILRRFGWDKKVRQLYDELHDFKNHKQVIVQAMLLSIAGQTVCIVVLYGMALALGASAGLIYFFLLVPVVHLASMLPISFGGLGVRESAYVIFLAPYIGKEYALALGILWLGLVFLMSIAGGLIYFMRQDYHIRFKQAPVSA